MADKVRGFERFFGNGRHHSLSSTAPLPRGAGPSREETLRKIRETEKIEREEREREARGEKVERRVAHLIRNPD